MRLRIAVALAATALAVAAGGCGFGPGEVVEGEVTLRVTEDFGANLITAATIEDPLSSDTVIGLLDRVAEIETSYGGNFVDAIAGRAGTTTGGGDHDWLYFVNGVWAGIGGGERTVRPGDQIWWDYRYWYEAARIPVVVGSWPEPFKSGFEGERAELVLRCRHAGRACAEVGDRLDAQGIAYSEPGSAAPLQDPERMRVLVGPFSELRSDPAAAMLGADVSTSGVYASFVGCERDRYELVVRGADGEPRQIFAEAGLVAALRKGSDQPTLVITGTDRQAVAEAAERLDPEVLRDRYAIAVVGGDPVPAPAPETLPRLQDAGPRSCA